MHFGTIFPTFEPVVPFRADHKVGSGIRSFGLGFVRFQMDQCLSPNFCSMILIAFRPHAVP